jgi:hypothetical protein
MAWTWNDSTVKNPQVKQNQWMDFDVDGDPDNNYLPYANPNPHPYRQGEQLGTTPEIAPASTSDSTDTWALNVGTNWLDAALTNVATCVPWDSEDACSPAQEALVEGRNRSSVWDVSNMYWDLHNDKGVSASELLTLYVSACPRGWVVEDDGCLITDRLPLERLLISADVSTISLQTEVQNALGAHVVH